MFLQNLKRLFWQIKFLVNGFPHLQVGIGGGKGGDSSPAPAAPPPSPEEIARAQVDAAISQRPRAAQAEFDILTNPNFGLGATTAEYNRVRSEQFPGESAVQEQLLQNILANLISPTGITPQQQQAVDTRRGTAQTELQESLRTRANLGGGLYGGRAGRTEERAVSDLQARFSEEDINRQETARLNAIQAALPALQVLFPELGLQAPQFINPVGSPDAQLSAITSTNQTNASLAAQAQQAELARQSALQSALFQGLGTAAGGAFGGGGIFGQKI